MTSLTGKARQKGMGQGNFSVLFESAEFGEYVPDMEAPQQ